MGPRPYFSSILHQNLILFREFGEDFCITYCNFPGAAPLSEGLNWGSPPQTWSQNGNNSALSRTHIRPAMSTVILHSTGRGAVSPRRSQNGHNSALSRTRMPPLPACSFPVRIPTTSPPSDTHGCKSHVEFPADIRSAVKSTRLSGPGPQSCMHCLMSARRL
jgi:hypothetical protein